ncbi:MAG: aminotransferase class V-fold PLP-dependent enzyme [Firmicutes bacterium]|nr:aminotransferase class V-fold PLP-dependent enzyme [Bacillota bacterium]
MPIKEFSNIIGRKCPDAVFHVDAVQSFGKLPISVNELGIDLLSASSHKIHGPRGLGILYVSERTKINPIFLGGGQQKKIRPGTEPVCLIAGFEKAIELCDIKNRLKKIERLNSYCRKKLNEIVGVNINSSKNASPYIINISVFGIKSEVLINFLSERGIYVSGSSACSKNKQSHVLKAMSLPKGFIESAIRISFSKFNTLDDIDVLVDNLKEALKIFSR